MKTPIFFKTYNSNQIHEADGFYYVDVGKVNGKSMIPTIKFFNHLSISDEIRQHPYFMWNEKDAGSKVYLVKNGDILYKVLKDTKLARITYPNAIEHKGWLLIG